MYYINDIDFFSINANMCAQKPLKHTCPDFDPVTPLSKGNYYKIFTKIP